MTIERTSGKMNMRIAKPQGAYDAMRFLTSDPVSAGASYPYYTKICVLQPSHSEGYLIMAYKKRLEHLQHKGTFFLSADFAEIAANKQCVDCKKSKPLSEFSKAEYFSTTYSPRCTVCWRMYMRRDSKKQYAADPIRQKIRCINARAAKFGVPGVLDIVEMRAMLEAANGLCFYCQQSWVAMGVTYHIDHVVPLSEYKRGNKEATNTASNVNVSCAFCNGAKRDYTLDQFKAWLRAVQGGKAIREQRSLYVV